MVPRPPFRRAAVAPAPRPRAAVAVLLLAAFSGARPAAAECLKDAAGGPRVGLVLSGGGARGLAHIGVLEVLEDEGIRIDCIAGASMGAPIGALAASGYSARQITEVVESLDWSEVFSGRRVRPLVPLSRRFDEEPPFVSAGIGAGLTLRLPAARRSDYRLNRLLFRLLAEPGLLAQGDFARLPIPFRTVATDLATVQPVVLARGSLARAVRASMSVPVLLPTTTIDGRVLVDGGLVDNVPVDLARAMGADVVIVVDVTSPPLAREHWRTLFGVGRQLVDELARHHARAWAQAADLVVWPDLEGRSAEDYSDPPGVIDAGRRAARAALPHIRALAPGARAAPPASVARPPLRIAGVTVANSEPPTARSVLAAFGVKPQDPFDVERLLRGVDRVWATGLFETIWLEVEAVPEGLRVVLDTAPRPRWTVALGAASDEADHVNAFVRLRNHNLFGHGEQLDLALLGGPRASGARVEVLGDGLWRPRVGYLAGAQMVEEQPVVYRAGGEIGRASFWRELGYLGAQASRGPDLLVRARLDVGRVRSDHRPGLGLLRGTDQHRVLRGLLAWDRLDDRDLPRSGLALSVRAERSLPGLGATFDYSRVTAETRAAWSPGDVVVLDAAARAGVSAGDVPVYDLFRLGGPLFVPGRPREELWGRQVLGLTARAGRDVFGFRVSAGAGAGAVWSRRSDMSLRGLRHGFVLGLARQTSLGLVAVQAGRDQDGRAAIYVATGRH